jgi:kinesin family protein 2/24
MPVSGLYDGASLYRPVRGRSFDDSEPYIANNKQTVRTRGLPDNNLLKSFAADKEKSSSVAKIKVVVCSFCSL